MYKTRIKYQPFRITTNSFAPGSSPQTTTTDFLVDYMERAGSSTGRNTLMRNRAFTSYSFQTRGISDGSFQSFVPTKYLSTGAVQSYGSSSSGSGLRGLSALNASLGDPNYSDPKVLAAISILDSNVRSQILNRIKGQKFDAGVFIGELSTTIGHIAHTANRISNAYTALRRGNLRGVEAALAAGRVSKSRQKRFDQDYKRDPLSAASNFWLEYQYGWRPLLSDAHNVAEAFASRNLGESPKRVKVSGIANQTVKNVLVTNIGLRNYQSTATFNLRVRRVCELQVSSPVFATASALGLTNPLNIAWNLLPFSFVVDWFLPVGDFLNNLDATAGMTMIRGTRAERLEGVTSTAVSESYAGGGGASASAQRKSTVYSRSVGLPSAIPPAPRFRVPGTLSHLGSALSLLQQSFGRR